MKAAKLYVISTACLGVASNAMANNVLLTSKAPIDITYHVVRVKGDGHPVFGELRSMKLNHSANIACDLKGHDKSGVVLVSVNGHVLPDNINQFNQPRNCTMTTDAGHPSGELELATTEHSIKCKTTGGVFG